MEKTGFVPVKQNRHSLLPGSLSATGRIFIHGSPVCPVISIKNHIFESHPRSFTRNFTQFER
jgi:hypothetical protein